MAEVFELHARERFEIVAFDNGWDDGSDIRRRIDAAFGEIVDITRMTDREAAVAVRSREIDVLVNLNEYFGDTRQGVFAHRPSAVQVNYLGFPGTLGAGYIDYLIADPTVIPEASRRHYCEKIAYLPDSYQANDRKRAIGDRTFVREELGLPESGFVFCCFNNSYKVTPATFDGWMRILARVPGSVLWLLEDDPTAARNLRNEAAARGVASERLVFAKRMPLADHLAPHRAADLFVDTLPYNAHTTASDALWAGLPLLTRMGTTFPGRVAASLLRAVGGAELITTTQEEYEALAVELATDPQRLVQISQARAESIDRAALRCAAVHPEHRRLVCAGGRTATSRATPGLHSRCALTCASCCRYRGHDFPRCALHVGRKINLGPRQARDVFVPEPPGSNHLPQHLIVRR